MSALHNLTQDAAENVPHSNAAEQGLLGSLLNDNGIRHRLPPVSRDHFYNPLHAKLFGDISDLIAAGKLADPIALYSRFEKAGSKSNISPEYLADLVMAAPAQSAAIEYAKMIIEFAARRSVIAQCAETTAMMQDPDADGVYGLIDEHLSDIAKIQRQGTGQKAFATTQDAVSALFSPDRPAKIDTGWKALDKIAGFPRGGITLVGGRASMGKSAFLIEAAFNAARRGLRVDLFSLEMSRAQIAARAISSHMARTSSVNGLLNSITYQRIYEQDLSDNDWKRIKAAAASLPSINFDDTPRLTVSDIKARCMDLAGTPDLVFIDYLNIMALDDCRNADRHDQKLGLVASRLRDFAKDSGAAVVLLCQLNRGNTTRDNNVPQLQDLRDSGELEQHADTVMFMHRQGYYLQREVDAKRAAGEDVDMELLDQLHRCANHFDVIIAKQRMGQISKALLRCNIEYNFIGDYDHE